ncbi:MAG: glycosyltransferase family 2 protein [Gaiellaceae bacterium]
MPASIVIVAYNSGPALARCLRSVLDEGGEHELIVVNNGARGPEIEEAASLPAVRVLEPEENLGYAGGSSFGAAHASHETLLFLNPDTTVAPGAVSQLERALDDESVAIAMGRLRLLDRPELLNSAGCVIHISGLAWSDGYGEPADSMAELREITYANGSVLAIRRERFQQLGGFTPELFLYHEDLELGWRARMQGYRVVLEPAANVFHEYDYSRNVHKNYFMERNRLIFVATAYSVRLLVLLAPVLTVAELGLLVVAWREGWLRDKLSGWWWCARNARWLLRHRRALQRARTVPDRDLARHLTPVIDPKMVPVPPWVARGNRLVVVYWSLVQRVL